MLVACILYTNASDHVAVEQNPTYISRHDHVCVYVCFSVSVSVIVCVRVEFVVQLHTASELLSHLEEER